MVYVVSVDGCFPGNPKGDEFPESDFDKADRLYEKLAKTKDASGEVALKYGHFDETGRFVGHILKSRRIEQWK